jgi:hypothetical protein
VEDVIRQDREKAVDNPPGDQRSPPPKPPVRQAKDALMESERELTTGLLSKDASFRLIVSGSVGVKEIERLIKKLELDKEIWPTRKMMRPPTEVASDTKL